MDKETKSQEYEVSEEDIVEKRKKDLAKSIKLNKNFVWNLGVYIGLILITWISVFIRTRNVSGLKDITTNSWTLGPDLDPFLFLRWAEYIVDHGKIMAIDTFRYTPLGFDTGIEKKLLSYMIAWFHQGFSIVSGDSSVTYSAIIFPVFMFALTCIAFFFLTRLIFSDSFKDKRIPDVIALIATLFLAVIPSILPRTIAGIPEKESVGFLFIFLSFYFIIHSFKSKSYLKASIFGVLAGISTAILGLVWGGVTFVFISIGVSAFVLFIIGQFNKKTFVGYVLWIASFMLILISTSHVGLYRNIVNYLSSTSTIPIFATLALTAFALFVYPLIKENKTLKGLNSKIKLSDELVSLIIVSVLLIIISIPILGFSFIPHELGNLKDSFVKPLAGDRFSVTVAENRQPFFVQEWTQEFGPIVLSKLPIFFWIFVIGSIVLFYNLVVKFEKRDKIILSASYVIALFALIFSRYSPNGVLNGVSSQSVLMYFGGIFIFLIASLYALHKYGKGELRKAFDIDFSYVLMFTLFFISIIAARGGVRFVMVVVPAASILASYLIVLSSKKAFDSLKLKDDMKKVLFVLLAIVLILLSIYAVFSFYNQSRSQAEGYVPGIYQWQWQNAMSWVRENTNEMAVFAHWWDYGYWVQSIGNRATFLDGGNLYSYWDHLMGRYVLTTPDDSEALSLLYTHNVTHLLIDSTDIGKYSAFSSIGSDENYDRYSFIPTFSYDSRSSKETNTGMLRVYSGGTNLDQDIVWDQNGSRLFFPQENSYIGAVLIEENTAGNTTYLGQPFAVFVQQNGNQAQVPLKYLYYQDKLYTFDNGLNAGVFMIQVITPVGNTIQMDNKGGLMYLSSKTIDGLLVRKYLFNEEGSFKLVHNEPSVITANLRSQGFQIDDFSYYQGNFLGPIKIWQVNYPSGMQTNSSLLETDYPNLDIKKV